jgi:hypothetical protein
VKKLLHEAQALLGLQLSVTGIMGTRTKHAPPPPLPLPSLHTNEQRHL